MIPAYSSGVPVRRLLESILGTSPATRIWAKRPSGVKIKMPLGVSPNRNDFLPCDTLTPATTKFQPTTVWSARFFAGHSTERQGKRGGGDGRQLHGLISCESLEA